MRQYEQITDRKSGMLRVRVFHDASLGKTWTVRLVGARTEVRQGPPGRERIFTRDHDDAEAAHRWVVKEEWARLKKGMILLDPNAAPGAPRLHHFIGGPYTGAMAIAPVDDDGFVCNRFMEPDGERSAGSDEMVHVGPDGGITAGFALPVGGLVWKAARVPDTDAVLLQVDGGIVRWGLGAGTAEEVLPYRPNPGFLGVGGGRLAGYDGADVVVLDLDGGAELCASRRGRSCTAAIPRRWRAPCPGTAVCWHCVRGLGRSPSSTWRRESRA